MSVVVLVMFGDVEVLHFVRFSQEVLRSYATHFTRISSTVPILKDLWAPIHFVLKSFPGGFFYGPLPVLVSVVSDIMAKQCSVIF